MKSIPNTQCEAKTNAGERCGNCVSRHYAVGSHYWLRNMNGRPQMLCCAIHIRKKVVEHYTGDFTITKDDEVGNYGKLRTKRRGQR